MIRTRWSRGMTKASVDMLLFGGVFVVVISSSSVRAQVADRGVSSAPRVGRGTSRPWRVLEATDVRARGPGGPLLPGELLGAVAELHLGARGRARLISGDDLLLSAVGPGRLLLGVRGRTRRVRLEGVRIAELSGFRGAFHLRRGVFVLAKGGATVLVSGDRLYVRRGAVRALLDVARKGSSLPSSPAASLSAAPSPTAPSSAPIVRSSVASSRPSRETLLLGAGERLLLTSSSGAQGVARARAPRALVAEVTRYRMPPRWMVVDRASLRKIVSRVRVQVLRQKLSWDADLSACTVRSGPGQGTTLLGGLGLTPTLEGRNATLGVRVRGIPRAPAIEGGK